MHWKNKRDAFFLSPIHEKKCTEVEKSGDKIISKPDMITKNNTYMEKWGRHVGWTRATSS